MTNLPRVTFIICHHNYLDYLGDAIRSARNQTYPSSICVIDDSSDDQITYETIVRKELFDNQPINCEIVGNQFTSTNGTHTSILLKGGPYKQAYARNRGIEATWDKTDIFAILDSDDTNYPRKIELLVSVMMLYPHVGVVYADYDILNVETGITVREFKKPFDGFELQRECIVHSGALIKKEAMEAVLEEGKFYEETLSPIEDYHAWLKINRKFMILHVAEALSLVKVHPMNSTNTSTHEFRVNQLRRMYEKLGFNV